MNKNVYFKIVLLLVATVFFSCTPEKKNTITHDGYTINGVLENLNSTNIYLVNDKNTNIDSAKISNNSFSLQGKVIAPTSYRLVLNNQKDSYPIIVENSNYNILINHKEATIFGGELNTKLNEYSTKVSRLNSSKLIALEQYLAEKIKSKILHQKNDSINLRTKNLAIEFIKENQNNLLAMQVYNTLDLSLADALALKENTSTATNSIFLTKLKNNITSLENSKKEALAKKEAVVLAKKEYRRPAIMFSGENTNGNSVSLRGIMSGKKAVLIDFWASWCGPCRTLTPSVRRIYNQYKNKGFTVLTVSEDKNRNAWINGITQDNMLSWNHMFDENGRISAIYDVRSIPFMILIDENGGIIKEKISISQLENELRKIFN